MTIAPNELVLVADPDAGAVTVVYVTSANLASVFTGCAYSSNTGAWLPQKLYAYEMVVGKVVRYRSRAASP